MIKGKLLAGAAEVDITPEYKIHLAGYPFIKRDSTGIHDRLLSSALYLANGDGNALFIGNDVIFISKDLSGRARKRIHDKTGIAEKDIIITATHTHSSPSTIEFVSGSHDNLLPPVDEKFINRLEDGIVTAGITAFNLQAQANLQFALADVTGIGTNRHSPQGAQDMQMPVLIVKNIDEKKVIACMLVCNMHPTVLQDDSTLISGDFPGIARLIIQQKVFKQPCPIIYHMGTAGNQSPRHVIQAKNFEEAGRLANIIATAVDGALINAKELKDPEIYVQQEFVELPRRTIPDIAAATETEKRCREQFDKLRVSGATRQDIRTAEVNWFGAMEQLNLAKLKTNGRLEDFYKLCMPAEIQVIAIGHLRYIAWPGEIFVEYGLEIKKALNNAFVITLSNGELQVYIATKDAADAGTYEACNALFCYTSGDILVKESIVLANKKS